MHAILYSASILEMIHAQRIVRIILHWTLPKEKRHQEMETVQMHSSKWGTTGKFCNQLLSGAPPRRSKESMPSCATLVISDEKNLADPTVVECSPRCWQRLGWVSNLLEGEHKDCRSFMWFVHIRVWYSGTVC